MSVLERVAILVVLIAVIAYACVLVARDAREPIGQTRAEILAQLADEQAIADDLDSGRS